MDPEEATSLIWRVLDGEADEGERAALEAAERDQPKVAALCEQARQQHEGLARLSEARRATLLDEGTLDEAFQRIAIRAAAEARSLEAIESNEGKAERSTRRFVDLIGRLFEPLPSLTGALAGAAVTFAGLAVLSGPQMLTSLGTPATGLALPSAPGALTPSVPLATLAGGFGPTRGVDDPAGLSEALTEMTALLGGPDSYPAEAVELGQQFERENPGLIASCTCDSYRFHMAIASGQSELGDFSAAGQSLIRAGQCLRLQPC